MAYNPRTVARIVREARPLHFDDYGYSPPDNLGFTPHQSIPDRAYQEVFLSKLAWQLCCTLEVVRLKHVWHLGLNPGMTVLNAGSSRFEHQLGAYWVLVNVLRHKKFRSDELVPYASLLEAAILRHDVGSPPFTHSLEPLLDLWYGYNHETLLAHPRYRDGEFSQILGLHGLDLDEVDAIVCEKHPVAALNQLIPFCDTADGIARYQMIWLHQERASNVQALLLANWLDCREGELVFAHPEDDSIQFGPFHWHVLFSTARREVFSYIYGRHIHPPQAMLERAVWLQGKHEAVPLDFFFLTDEEATRWLRATRRAPGCRRLIDSAERGLALQPVMPLQTPSEKELSPAWRAALGNVTFRQCLSDWLCKEFRVSADSVAILSGKDKSFKPLSRFRFVPEQPDRPNEYMEIHSHEWSDPFCFVPPQWVVGAYAIRELAEDPSFQSQVRQALDWSGSPPAL